MRRKQRIKCIILQEMGVKIAVKEYIDEVRRMGKYNIERKRPIIVKLNRESTKIMILQKNRRLKGTNIWIDEDYPKEVQEERRKLIIKIKEARNKGHKAQLRYNKLIINDELYWEKDTDQNQEDKKEGCEGSSSQKRTVNERSPEQNRYDEQGIYEEGAIQNLARETKKYQIDILAMQKTHLTGNTTSDIQDYIMFTSGNQSLNFHAPTEEKDEETKDEFYEELERVYDEIPKSYLKIILEDANANVGKEEIYKNITGGESKHDISNNNGLRLINLAIENDMKIMSTHFKRKYIHKGTWIIPDLFGLLACFFEDLVKLNSVLAVPCNFA
ncbi:unnamed protein product [Psylliodes chrysocephalus]|uniref:Uncharacterized protein n=1 Tax=Psylliodes chrysocephalus TaxID=3402493 RepID=A0A9P0D9B4_9CUCU|nr:unnamed protein product [Psylliodes chrysocephala]